MKVLSLFSGIGAFEQALKNKGIEFELVGFSEIDKYAIESYCKLHDVNKELNLGDITQINKKELPIVDLLTHGSPCQSVSIAGLQHGADKGSGTRSSLLWNSVEIIEQCEPRIVIWENVKNVLSEKHNHNFEKYLKAMAEMGYKNYYKILNAKDYGIPQSRERVFVISTKEKEFKFPEKEILLKDVKDFLEEEVEQKYFLTPLQNERLRKNLEEREENNDEFKIVGSLQKHAAINKKGIVPTLTNAMGSGGGHIPMHNYNGDFRKLTPRECWRLMGFKDEQFDKVRFVCSNTQLYKQAGNSICVNVLERILGELI